MSRQKIIAVLATLDTKGDEAQYLREEIERLGAQALLIDIGVIGSPAARADVSREELARLGGQELSELQQNPTRESATPVMIAGAVRVLRERLAQGTVHGVLGLGGFQGTGLCTAVMRALPYGFPKVMVSTAASGDTSSYVGIKDVTMMFSVADILGLNALTRGILTNAAGAAVGMARAEANMQPAASDKPLIGISNLGVLTKGTQLAIERFQAKGYETVVFHAIGSGGAAMEELMREGVIGAVFDYAMGEIADGVYGVLRAGTPDRLTVAGKLGLPQVLVPGGAEHLGILVEENTVPEAWKDHDQLFHSPVVFVPRLRADEFARVGAEILRRLAHTQGNATLMLPLDGTSSYGAPAGPLRDEASDAALFETLRQGLPDSIELIERPYHAEHPEFVAECVDRLIARIEG